MTWGEKGRAVWNFVLPNVDALGIILVVLVVLGLEIFGEPERELIDATLLALIGILGVVLLRDRHGRTRVDEIAAFVQDLQSDRPYEVQSETNQWDIETRAHATFSKRQRLVFTRNEVCTLEHWTTGAGSVALCAAEWRLGETDPWIGATTIHDFGIRNGRNYIFSLDMERSRGDALHWQVKRTLRDRFPNPRESVSLRLQAPTYRPRMHVVWPPGEKPQHVELRRDDGPGQTLHPRQRADGRFYVDEQLAAGAARSSARIEWSW